MIPIRARRTGTQPPPPRRSGARAAVATAAAAVTALALASPTAPTALAAEQATGQAAGGPSAAACPTSVSGGATVPFRTYEAECASHTGSAIGPDFTQASLASEASGRQAVQLSAPGQHVEFTLAAPANSINVHYSVPDGRSGTLSVYVNGTRLASRLTLTSRHSYIDTPWITGAKTHNFYSDVRLLLGRDLGVGDRVRLQVDSGDTATPYTIDLADFEQVGAAGTRPANSVSVTDFGATPDDGGDDSNAFRQAISAARAQSREVWVPPGRFEIPTSLQLDQVTVRGAGQWYTVLHGNNVFQNSGVTGNIRLHDFAVFGDVTERNDGSPDNAYHGSFGANSVVSGLWIQNTKCGLWLMNGATSNLVVENNRILDVLADGINFDGNVRDSVIRNNYLRNTGDDALALWSNGSPNVGNSILNNTVVSSTLANGIAVYGGTNNTVSGNLVRDTNALGGGIHVANRFNATPLSGTVKLDNNVTLRAGALDPNWKFGVGALWFDGRDSAFSGVSITVTNFRAVDSPYEAIQFIDGGGTGKPMQGVTVNGASIEGTGTFAVQAQTTGTVTLNNVTATRVGVVGTYNCPFPTDRAPMVFTGSGNSGLTPTWTDCTSWPPPNSGPPTQPGTGSNAAKGRPVTASGSQGGYPPGNAVDGNADTYWESTNNAFPQTLTVDLGEPTSVNKITLKLPPSSSWGTRTQTVTIAGSTDGGGYSTIVAARGYTFDPATGNTASVSFGATSPRYVRLTFTANTGWPAGQLSELEVLRS